MKGYKKLSVLLAAFVCGLFPLTACSSKEEPLTQIPILSTATERYGTAYIARQGERLHDSIGVALEEYKGTMIANVWKNNSRALALCTEIGESFENRGIARDTYGDLVVEFCSSTEFFSALLNGEMQARNSFLQLFNTLARALGIHDATRIGYDLLLRYCDYEKLCYLDRYEKAQNQLFLVEAQAWENNKIGIQAIGEEKFSALTRCLLAGASVLSLRAGEEEGESFLDTLYAGEAALFLRTQGELMQQVQMTKEDYAFLIRFAGEVLNVRVCAAIAQAGKDGEYAAKAQGCIDSLSAGLTNADTACGRAFLSGDFDGGVQMLSNGLSEEQKAAIEGFLTVENDSESYQAYLSAQRLTKEFEKYCEGNARGEVEECVYAHSPELAFLVFGI